MFDYVTAITVENTRGKVIFWDIDGTLVPYRWPNGVGDVDHYGEKVCPAIEDGLCLNRHPSKHMQRVVTSCGAKRQFVLGHYEYAKETIDKIDWLHAYYPQIEQAIFIKPTQSKADALIQFCRENDIPLKCALFVDDRIDILKEAEAKGIECWHISSFLDWFEYNS